MATGTGRLAHAILSMAESRKSCMRREIEDEFTDCFLEVRGIEGKDGRRSYKIQNGTGIVISTNRGFTVKDLEDLSGSHFGSAAAVVNWMSAHGYKSCSHSVQDMLDLSSGGRFLFCLKVRRSFLRSNREKIFDTDSDADMGAPDYESDESDSESQQGICDGPQNDRVFVLCCLAVVFVVLALQFFKGPFEIQITCGCNVPEDRLFNCSTTPTGPADNSS